MQLARWRCHSYPTCPCRTAAVPVSLCVFQRFDCITDADAWGRKTQRQGVGEKWSRLAQGRRLRVVYVRSHRRTVNPAAATGYITTGVCRRLGIFCAVRFSKRLRVCELSAAVVCFASSSAGTRVQEGVGSTVTVLLSRGRGVECCRPCVVTLTK